MGTVHPMAPDGSIVLIDKSDILSSIKNGFKKTLDYMHPDYWNDKTVCTEIASRWGKYSQFFSDELRDDADVMGKAIESYPYSYRWASKNAKTILDLKNSGN